MAKQGQHKDDRNDPRKSKGNNNPAKSVTVTTGSYKKQESYEQRARAGQDPEPQAQAARNEWQDDTREESSPDGKTRPRHPGTKRTGSDSNASRRTRGY